MSALRKEMRDSGLIKQYKVLPAGVTVPGGI